MPESFSIGMAKGDLGKVARALNDAGTRDLRRVLRKAMSEETKPTRRKIKQSALDNLPQRGGLNRWAARMPNANTDFRPKYAGVRIRLARRGNDLVAINRGRLRHPVFGNRTEWVTQGIAPGFFDKPIEEDSGDLKRRITAVATRFIYDVQRRTV